MSCSFLLDWPPPVFFSLVEAILFLTVRLAYTPELARLDWPDFWRSWRELPQAVSWGFRQWNKGIFIVLGLAALIVFYFPTSPGGGLLVVPFWPLTLGLSFYVLKVTVTGLQSLTSVLHGWTEAGVEWVREAYVRTLDGTMRAANGCSSAAPECSSSPSWSCSSALPSASGRAAVQLYPPLRTRERSRYFGEDARQHPASVVNDLSGRVENWLLSQHEVLTTQAVVNTSGSGKHSNPDSAHPYRTAQERDAASAGLPPGAATHRDACDADGEGFR